MRKLDLVTAKSHGTFPHPPHCARRPGATLLALQAAGPLKEASRRVGSRRWRSEAQDLPWSGAEEVWRQAVHMEPFPIPHTAGPIAEASRCVGSLGRRERPGGAVGFGGTFGVLV